MKNIEKIIMLRDIAISLPMKMKRRSDISCMIVIIKKEQKRNMCIIRI